MNIVRKIAVVGAMAGLLGSTAAMAGESVRSSAALPTVQSAAAVPTTSGVRTSHKLKHKSGLASSAIVPAILAVAVVGAGIYVAVDSDDDADSPG